MLRSNLNKLHQKSCIIRNYSAVLNNDNNRNNYDIVIVGGGIVGAATARQVLIRYPKLRLALVEKECKLAVHQSGHNSGVVHAGIYYKPGSLKARLCVEGLDLTYKYCDKKKIPYKKCGKLIVATNKIELGLLSDLLERGKQNKVADLQVVEGEQIQEIEPHCRGIKAIWSPHTGIVDWALVTEYYGDDFKRSGGEIYYNFEVTNFKESNDTNYPVLVTEKNNKSIKTKYVLTCCGLQSDKLAEISGCPKSPRIVPFRGEYLLLDPKKCHMIKGNIYPVPDPRFPFLGVHFTPRMDGSVWLGPNAVLAFKREGYNWSDINVSELLDALSYSGFRKLAFKYALAGATEIIRSAFTTLQVKELQKYVPDVTRADVSSGPSGVRAQAVDADGNLVDDFYFDKGSGALGKRILHCRNAPSPGATSSLAIAKMMADKLKNEFNLNWDNLSAKI